MVLLLSRCWEYKLKTEDVLELTQGNRRIALCTIVGLLEDGETYSTTLKQRQKPKEGQMAQWEHELIIQRYLRFDRAFSLAPVANPCVSLGLRSLFFFKYVACCVASLTQVDQTS